MGADEYYGGAPRPGQAARLPPYLQPRPYGGGHHVAGSSSGGRVPAGPAPPSPAATPFPTGPRPFVVTRGRVGDDVSDISLETQVTTNWEAETGYGVWVTLGPESRAIVAMCGTSVSVAEISARLGLHLGVTKVLVSDLHAAGRVFVHTEDVSTPFSTEIILRVMHGLRAIS